MQVDDGKLILSTGRRIIADSYAISLGHEPPNRYQNAEWTLGLGFRECALDIMPSGLVRHYAPYQGLGLSDRDGPLTHEERIEIAEYMIGLWTRFKEAQNSAAEAIAVEPRRGTDRPSFPAFRLRG